MSDEPVFHDQRRHSYLITPDHDLLIQVNTRLEDIQKDWPQKMESMKAEITLLRASSATSVEVADHEKRLRKLERYYWLGLGAILAADFLMKAFGK